jgi:hypothetical protein
MQQQASTSASAQRADRSAGSTVPMLSLHVVFPVHWSWQSVVDVIRFEDPGPLCTPSWGAGRTTRSNPVST